MFGRRRPQLGGQKAKSPARCAGTDARWIAWVERRAPGEGCRGCGRLGSSALLESDWATTDSMIKRSFSYVQSDFEDDVQGAFVDDVEDQEANFDAFKSITVRRSELIQWIDYPIFEEVSSWDGITTGPGRIGGRDLLTLRWVRAHLIWGG